MSQWQLELKNAVKNYPELFKLINLDVNLIDQYTTNKLINKLPLLVTKSFIKRIKPGDPKDPLLLQILPNILETNNFLNYSTDPLQEKTFNQIPGLIHKYHGRVLILSTKNCAIHCQYCFRQNFPYTHNIANLKNLNLISAYIAKDPSIKEIILSGGDPLLTSNNYLKKLLNTLKTIPHLTTVRIHSRIPIVLPSRLDSDLIKIFKNTKFNIVLVTHANHPNEINSEVANYIKKLSKTKILLLNQSVLLNKVNDDPNTLAALSEKLFNLKILPYYLHTLDPVKGAEHFTVTIEKTKKIFKNLTEMLPGYLVPKLVTEKPGEKSKTLINYNDLDILKIMDK